MYDFPGIREWEQKNSQLPNLKWEPPLTSKLGNFYQIPRDLQSVPRPRVQRNLKYKPQVLQLRDSVPKRQAVLVAFGEQPSSGAGKVCLHSLHSLQSPAHVAAHHRSTRKLHDTPRHADGSIYRVSLPCIKFNLGWNLVHGISASEAIFLSEGKSMSTFRWVTMQQAWTFEGRQRYQVWSHHKALSLWCVSASQTY